MKTVRFKKKKKKKTVGPLFFFCYRISLHTELLVLLEWSALFVGEIIKKTQKKTPQKDESYQGGFRTSPFDDKRM